jgi:PST family polysaccharide transporter
MIVSVVVGVAALLVAVRWGIVVVAGAMVAQAVLLTPLLLWAVGKLIALHPITYLRQVLAPTVGSVVMVVAVIAVRRFAESSLSLPAALAIDIVVGGLVYVGAMRLLSPSLTREAIDLVRVAMPRRRDAVNSVDSHP